VPADTADLDGDGNTVEPIPFDVGGSQRIEDGDRDGKAVIDMGALEFNVTAYEITVLTYNTHLFGDSTLAQFCTQWPWSMFCDIDDFLFRDRIRRYHIACKVEESGADIVALQEVWAWSNQNWFVNRLKDTYPFGLINYSACVSSYGGTLGNGLVLLSKFPLSDGDFKRFPTYTYESLPANDDSWANKGVLTATVETGLQPVRVGISHALTGGVDRSSEWSPDYVGTAITTFDVNGQPYIFALKSDSNQAYITRMDDYSDYNEQDPNQSTYGAGWKHVYDGFWDSDYLAVVSFELNGHPYLFGLKSDSNQVDITRINDDPSTGWNHSGPYYSPWDKDYRGTTITSFQLNGEAYIFGQKSTGNQARITRINTDPCTGELDSTDPFEDFGLFPCDSNYSAVVSFELDGHPSLFGHESDSNQVWISRINDDPSTGWTDMYQDYWDRQYVPTAITSFQLNDHPYILGLATNEHAYITRINDDPCTGGTDVNDTSWEGGYVAIKSFQMNGHPYLFGLRNCCAQYDDVCGRERPGEAYLTRINDNPSSGCQFVYQMEDIQIIRDQTVGKDDMFAIMMGDFNVHLSKYGVMDNIFEKTGAVDAYIQVHGTGAGGETIDLGNNKLHQEFSGKDPCDPCDYPTEGTFDRIDYVYVTPSGTGFELVPTEAHVIRDWKFDDVWDNIPDLDLSDHYPLMVKFQIRRPADFNADGAVDFVDYAILSEYWLTDEPSVDIAPQPAGDGIIDERDLDVLCENWLAGK
jgi:endonuclease/exonuclease/phosphatase family metal-dependent hydrolase